MDEQDMRKMGGLLEVLPFTYILMVIGSAALMALPFTPADYSKELIIELAFSDWHIHSLFIYWLLLLAACCTSIYSIALLENVFLNVTNLPKQYFEQIHDASLLMLIPLFILGVASIFVGYIFKDLFVGIGTDSFQDSISNYNNIIFLSISAAEFLNILIKCIPLIFGLFLTIFDFEEYEESFLKFETDGHAEENSEEEFEEFFTQKWDFDLLYNYVIVNPLITSGYTVTGLLIDRGLLEFIGPTGLVRGILEKKTVFLTIASGYLYRYVFWMIISIFYIFFLIKFSLDLDYIVIFYIYTILYTYIYKI
jgi:NADH-ubiquinone oxidoreductase chain 5